MNANIPRQEVAAGYAFAGATLCLGLYLGVKAGGEAGITLIRGFYLLAVLIVLKFTFAWRRLRGFAVRNEDGNLSGEGKPFEPLIFADKH